MDPRPIRPRWDVAREALPAVARSSRWAPLSVSALLAVVLVALRHDQQAAGPMQTAAILLAGGAGFALDDPATETLAASPTPLLLRRSLRLLVMVPPVMVLWGLLLRWQGTEGSAESVALTILFAGLMGLSLAVAGVAGRTTWLPGRGGLAAPPAILVMVFLSGAIPRRWRPLPLGDVPGGWTQIYIRWAAAAAVGTLVLLMSSSDPAGSVRRRLDRWSRAATASGSGSTANVDQSPP